MKRDAVEVRAPYRNAALFRSAERLIASSPKKPDRLRPSRTFVFAVGLTCGFGLALLLLPLAFEAITRAMRGDEPAANIPANLRHRFTFTGQDSKNAAPAPATSTTLTEAASAPATAPTPVPTPRRNSIRSAATAPSSASRVTGRAPPVQTIIITQSTTRIMLKGELRSPSSSVSTAPIVVNFDLHFQPGRRDGSLQGLVQVLDDANPQLAFRVAGILSKSTITLSEIQKTSAEASLAPSGYVFVIELPAATATGEFLGRWTHGATRGNLVVRSALAF